MNVSKLFGNLLSKAEIHFEQFIIFHGKFYLSNFPGIYVKIDINSSFILTNWKFFYEIFNYDKSKWMFIIIYWNILETIENAIYFSGIFLKWILFQIFGRI